MVFTDFSGKLLFLLVRIGLLVVRLNQELSLSPERTADFSRKPRSPLPIITSPLNWLRPRGESWTAPTR
jgi:hypothetical protein